mmetsp:Transcript_11968/g.12869  ORF Transcript_11968/g.12869 Transcript_11968/m.12869 type:complete len:212 (-) Transcript_11968:71-706(-)
MKISTTTLSVAVAAVAVALVAPASPTSAFTFSIASGLPIRRSIAKFNTDEKVPEEVVTKAAEAALLAPNHFLSEPTRMYSLGPEAITKLKALNEDKAKLFDGVPGWMVFTIKTEHLDDDGNISAKLALEDHATVACATQNFMQSLAEDGIGSKWMTGALGMAPEDILTAIGAPDDERMVSVVWYGTPTKPLTEAKAPKRKLGVDQAVIQVA